MAAKTTAGKFCINKATALKIAKWGGLALGLYFLYKKFGKSLFGGGGGGGAPKTGAKKAAGLGDVTAHRMQDVVNWGVRHGYLVVRDVINGVKHYYAVEGVFNGSPQLDLTTGEMDLSGAYAYLLTVLPQKQHPHMFKTTVPPLDFTTPTVPADYVNVNLIGQ